jgi:indole-3-glycerol phosphate synthase
MSGFLQKIADITRERVAKAKQEIPAATLEQSPLFNRAPHNAQAAFLQDGYNIIAEIKFASPSEGSIHPAADPVPIAEGYLNAGAKMLSILTEPQFFKGEPAYLQAVRTKRPDAVLLRKDFMVDEYQLLEARAWGADAILLIVAMTDAKLTKDLFDAARGLKLSALVEVHDDAELDAAIALGADFIGVNNRNLKTLKTDLDTGRRLALKKPEGAAFICESGLSTAEDLKDMRARGYDGFLMGTSFMRKSDPGKALQELRGQLCA